MENPEASNGRAKRHENKNKSQCLAEDANARESLGVDRGSHFEENNTIFDDGNTKSSKKNWKNKLLGENIAKSEKEEQDSEIEDDHPYSNKLGDGNQKPKTKKQFLEGNPKDEGVEEVARPNDLQDKNLEPEHGKAENKKIRKKKRLLEEAAKAKMRGVCYLSRIPPHMDHVKLRQILSQYGEIQRIYLAPEDPSAQIQRKRAGGFRGQNFSEGWVEFADKRIAKRVANTLNGEQIGGRKRSTFYYDIWNIKYLSNFKWDDLTEEIAYKSAIREQKLALEISAAKRERDFYLSKFDKSRALSAIDERLKKKQKVQQELGTTSVIQQVPKVIRDFPQRQPLTENAAQSKPRLSKDILAGVFRSA